MARVRYLLDTNICIYFAKRLHGVGERMKAIGLDACRISEVTYAELLYGAENSSDPARNKTALELFVVDLKIIPISACLGLFASEKARLRRAGVPISDFDLLIGATAVHHDHVLVTNNTRHMERIRGINLENWTL